MKRLIVLISTVLCVALLSGCVAGQSNRYSWGDYDGSLYSYYKNPADSAAYMKALEEVVQTAEKFQKPLAPGLYAEYGYMLMQQKKEAEAIAYFNKQKNGWPESAYFMDGMIKNVKINSDKKSAASESVTSSLNKSNVAIIKN